MTIVPTWHPAAALRPGGEDKLAWTGAAIRNFLHAKIPTPPPLCGATVYASHIPLEPDPGQKIAIDTEGTPDDPFCLTYGWQTCRWFVHPEDAAYWWKVYGRHVGTHIYHNAPWDWAVMEAMGIERPQDHPFVDTMELAYLRQTEPQGLKDLAWRHLRIMQQDWKATVRPAWEEGIIAYAAGLADADTVVDKFTKTGKLRKKPIHRRGATAKLLYKAVESRNADLLAKKLPDFPPPSSRQVPFDQMLQYATMDPFLTYKVWEVLK
jgi:hypothetical protein